LWQSLNFITARDLAQFAARADLRLTFERGVLAATVARLATDPAFARRQGTVGRIARTLARAGFLDWISAVPPTWQTPMVFTLERCSH
jgi:hypothetical protein